MTKESRQFDCVMRDNNGLFEEICTVEAE